MSTNVGHLRGNVLNKLFKLYCSFYGSQMRRLGSVYFNKVCTAWNIAVRKICNLPYNNNNNNIYLKSSIQTSSIDYKNYYGMYKYNKYDYTN